MTEVVAFGQGYFALFSYSELGLVLIFEKNSRLDPGGHISYSKPTFKSLIRQVVEVVEGGNTKVGGWFYPTMDKGRKVGTRR